MANGDGFVYRFGPYLLDAGGRRLLRGADIVALSPRQLQILRILASNPGRIVAREAIVETVWGDTPITDNALDGGVSGIRKAIDPKANGGSYIESIKRRGYRLADVERLPIADPSVPLTAMLEPHRARMAGRAALETLSLDAIARVADPITRALSAAPADAALLIQLALINVLRFEATRADASPDRAALDEALVHANEAVRLAPSVAEAWSTLGYVLGISGRAAEGLTACFEAIAREGDNWRHWIRVAQIAAGEERLRAVQRSLALTPHLPSARWLAATVFIARRSFSDAIDHLRAGCAAQDSQPADGGRFPMVGLHMQYGLMLLEQDQPEAAIDEFRRELASPPNQIYSRECFANTHYAIGAALLRLNHADAARAELLRVFTFIKGHGRATAALAVIGGSMEITSTWHGSDPIDAAMARAIPIASSGDHEAAAAIVAKALEQAPPGQAGWQLPVEPMLHTSARADAWSKALALVAMRAM